MSDAALNMSDASLMSVVECMWLSILPQLQIVDAAAHFGPM
jgi:hypothetical protein